MSPSRATEDLLWYEQTLSSFWLAISAFLPGRGMRAQWPWYSASRWDLKPTASLRWKSKCSFSTISHRQTNLRCWSYRTHLEVGATLWCIVILAVLQSKGQYIWHINMQSRLCNPARLFHRITIPWPQGETFLVFSEAQPVSVVRCAFTPSIKVDLIEFL